MNENPRQNHSGGPTIVLEVSSNEEGSNYWKNLVVKLMKRIPPVPPENL